MCSLIAQQKMTRYKESNDDLSLMDKATCAQRPVNRFRLAHDVWQWYGENAVLHRPVNNLRAECRQGWQKYVFLVLRF